MKTKAWLVLTMSGAFLGLGVIGAVGPLMARDLSQVLTGSPGIITLLANGIPGGLASDGTNFLVTGQSLEGRAIAMCRATSGVLLSSLLDLGPGGMPGAAFGGGTYFLVWPDSTEPPSDLYGQFINPDGTAAGNPFLGEGGADAAAVGGVAFDGTNFLVVWEGVGENINSTIEACFVSPTGIAPAPGFQISGGGTPQKLPAVAWNGTNYLVTWTSQLEGTNLWNIRGSRISPEGVSLGEIVISDNPAQQAWPPAVASDGTNWLVVWTRETGPYLFGSSNAFFPMLYGRLVSGNSEIAGSELVLRRAGRGQFHPSVAFSAGHYLVAWSENDADRYWPVLASVLAPSGEPVLAPLRFTTLINTDLGPSGLRLAAGGGGWLCVFDVKYTTTNIFANFAFHPNERPVPPAISNFVVLPTGEAQFDLWGYIPIAVETSTNLVDWGTDELGEAFYQLQGGQVTVPAPIGGINQTRFFRAFSARFACIDNLRLIQEAKDHWALDHNFGEVPVDSDLFGPGRYLPSKPVCPHHGTYSIQPLETKPTCIYAVFGHAF